MADIDITDDFLADVFSHRATRAVEQAQLDAGIEFIDPISTLPMFPSGVGRSVQDTTPAREPIPITKVAIIGSGCAGLYAAMLLQSVNKKVDVLEANDERVGGRLYTHEFGTGKWDYFDVGAMRFPDTKLMKKTFQLFDYLNIPKAKYSISKDDNFVCYNEIPLRKSAVVWADDPFKVTGTLPAEWAKQNPSDLLYNAVKPYIKRLSDARNNFPPGSNELKEAYQSIFDEIDKYSTRSYLRQEMKYPPDVINWIETLSFGTGWFDRAFVETVMEMLAFQYDTPSPTDLDWYCVEGGSQMIIKGMEQHLAQSGGPTVDIKKGHQVTAVKLHPAEPHGDSVIKQNPYLTLHYSGEILGPNEIIPDANTYSHVIFAIPPPCIRMIDVTTCKLDFGQRKALRELQLAPSSKVGMNFDSAWWKEERVGITKGGQSTTDRVVRTIVYPSQGDFSSTTLIASYSWTQDSLAAGALMQGPGSPQEERLKEVMLADLAYIHNYPLEELRKKLIGFKAFDWMHNPNSIGAFGLFAPSQFEVVYSNLTRPAAEGQIHFIGETYSTIHGWVAGALESAERGVIQMLLPEQARSGGGNPPMRSGIPQGQDDTEDDAPLDKLKNQWNTQLMVSETINRNQVLLSLKLQGDEFGTGEVAG